MVDPATGEQFSKTLFIFNPVLNLPSMLRQWK
jgi:hypothetical protein